MLKENLRKLNEVWKKEGLSLASPPSEVELIEKFDKRGIVLAQDAVEVYTNLGGMNDRESDSVFFSFWTIDKIIEQNEAGLSLVLFADFLIESHFYVFKFESELLSSIHIVWGENQSEKIAGSFEEFFEHYLINPEKFYLLERENEKT